MFKRKGKIEIDKTKQKVEIETERGSDKRNLRKSERKTEVEI